MSTAIAPMQVLRSARPIPPSRQCRTNDRTPSAVMLSGTYELEGEVSRRPLNALPSLFVLARDAWDSPLVGLPAEEIVKDDPGQEAVLDQLLIAVLRVWFARRGRSLVLVPGQGTSWLSVRHA